jgi:MFS family permease
VSLRLGRFTPPSPLAARLSVQSLLFAVGSGTFTTSSAVFFTQVVGLSAAQVGLGITLGGVVAFLTALPAGRLADRVGPQWMWCATTAGAGFLFAAWPFIDGLGGFLVMAVLVELLETAGRTGYGAYVLNVLPAEEGVRSRAYMYSTLNLGFTLGAALGGVALAFQSDTLIRVLPWFTCVLCFANAAWIARLPRLPRTRRTAELQASPETALGGSALRNRGFLATAFFGGVLNTNQVLLQIVIPLWLVEETDAPRVLLAWLFGTNTVMCIFLPMVTARGVRDLPTALRAARISTAFFVVSCLVTLVTHDTVGWTTILLVWLGHVTVTGAELYLAAAKWSFEAELSDPDRRGEYQGADNFGGTLGYVWAPAVYTYLAMHWGAGGWLLIAAVVLAASLGLGPSTRAATSYLRRHELDPTR